VALKFTSAKEIQNTLRGTAKVSKKTNGIIHSYAVSTNQGLIRNYNEDRVSIILNLIKPKNKICLKWPRCSFFGIYDGHGGSGCADYLKDHLHKFVIREESFP
jgi:protein phosphatase 2C family protein 2/3